MIRKIALLFVLIFCSLIIFPIKAKAAPTITSITPNTANNWGRVEITELAGTGFESNTKVTLRRAGESDIDISVIVESDTKITGIFDATGIQPGTWDVVVTDSENESTALTSGFTFNH
jgi:hypothetical protein